ncbi:MAG: ATP-grasp domain-containing protein [Bacteroidales bacterium]|nr:ATP-grasp domain-containing protein [Bacteroidales bacterium]MBS3775284.1 ATP-grasp domain-containing protein [Bacteroidales bacterium]
MTDKKQIFVVGLDDFNLEKLKRLPEASDCDFLPAVKYEEMRGLEQFDMKKLIETAFQRIDQHGRIDAVVSYYDFPGTDLVPIIASRYNLTGPSLESVLKCEHKYWSRLEQNKVIPRSVPMFMAFDPFDNQAYQKIEMIPPFWIKPIKSFRSFLAYRINSEYEFNDHMQEVREHIDYISEPFNYIFKNYQLPEEFAYMKETCIAESPISGHQCTVEGYVFDGEVVVYGIIDSVREEDRSSFARYEYPSSLPQEIQFRMADLARRVITQIGLNNSPFNIEFFYNHTVNQIFLLEINPRISQAHTDIFEKVHGISHHSIMLNIALGSRPKALEYKGKHRIASNFMLRIYESGRVKKIPSQEEVDKLNEKYPELTLKLHVTEGMHLSDLKGQDSYSYELGNMFLGARNQEELIQKYDDCMANLTFDVELDEVPQVH